MAVNNRRAAPWGGRHNALRASAFFHSTSIGAGNDGHPSAPSAYGLWDACRAEMSSPKLTNAHDLRTYTGYTVLVAMLPDIIRFGLGKPHA